jgi:hypothetical protein
MFVLLIIEELKSICLCNPGTGDSVRPFALFALLIYFPFPATPKPLRLDRWRQIVLSLSLSRMIYFVLLLITKKELG